MATVRIDPTFDDTKRRRRLFEGDVIDETTYADVPKVRTAFPRDTRVHPAPRSEIDETGPRLCVVPPVGAIMLFSGDQRHPTIPNKQADPVLDRLADG